MEASHSEPDDFDAPDYLAMYPIWAFSAAEQEQYEGRRPTVEEEEADRMEARDQRGWRE